MPNCLSIGVIPAFCVADLAMRDGACRSPMRHPEFVAKENRVPNWNLFRTAPHQGSLAGRPFPSRGVWVRKSPSFRSARSPSGRIGARFPRCSRGRSIAPGGGPRLMPAWRRRRWIRNWLTGPPTLRGGRSDRLSLRCPRSTANLARSDVRHAVKSASTGQSHPGFFVADLSIRLVRR